MVGDSLFQYINKMSMFHFMHQHRMQIFEALGHPVLLHICCRVLPKYFNIPSNDYVMQLGAAETGKYVINSISSQ